MEEKQIEKRIEKEGRKKIVIKYLWLYFNASITMELPK